MAEQSNIILQIIARLRDEISAPLASIKQAVTGIKPAPLEDLGKAAEGAGRKAREAKSAFDEVVLSAVGFSAGFGTTQVFDKIVDGFVEATKASLEFESALSRIRVVSDDAAVHSEEFGHAIREQSTKYGEGATEIADATALIAQKTGLAGDGLLKFGETAIQLSHLGLGDLRTSVSLTADILKAFGIDNSKAQETMFKVFEAAKLGKVPFQEMASFLAYTGATAKTAGVSLDELAVITGKLTSGGLTPQQTEFGLRGFLTQISNTADPVRQKIERFTGSLDEALKSATPLAAVLEKMQKLVPPEEFNTIFGSARTGTALRQLAQKDMPEVLGQIQLLGPQSQEAFGKLAEELAGTDNELKRFKESVKNNLGAPVGEAGTGFEKFFLRLGSIAGKAFNSKDKATYPFENVVKAFVSQAQDELDSQNAIADGIAKSVDAASASTQQLVVPLKQITDVAEHIPSLEEKLGVEKAQQALQQFVTTLKGPDFHGILSADQVPEVVRKQFTDLQKLVQDAASGRFHKPDTTDATDIKALEDETKSLRAFFDTVRKAQEATLPTSERQIAAIDDQIRDTQALLAERTKLYGAEIANAETLKQVSALQTQRERLVTNSFLEQNLALDKMHETSTNLVFPLLSVATAIAKAGAAAHAFKIEADALEKLKTLRQDLEQQKGADFEIAIKPQIEIDKDRTQALIRRQVEPLLANLITIDPNDIIGKQVAMQKLADAIREAARAAADFGKGFSAGFQDKLTEFADTTRQGYELATRSIDAFANASQQAIQGILEGTANARDILRGFAHDFSAIASQILSQRLFGALFGGLSGSGTHTIGGEGAGISYTAKADGGVISGGLRSFAPGGIAVGPQFALIGDNHAQREAIVPLPGAGRGIPVEFKNGGGGGSITVQVSYSVTALDARGVRELLVEHGRVIGDIAADQIRTGRHAGLRESVRKTR
jgi:TP901 family phage tail tape measure protein